MPMIGGTGYIYILRGVDAFESLRLREEAIAARTVARLDLDDGYIPDCKLFDNPLGILPKPDRPWGSTLTETGGMAIVLHPFYSELWPEFELFLGQMQRPFDLWVTHCGFPSPIRKQIVAAFPQAKLIEVENRGHDFWPFLSLLNTGNHHSR
jgi:hypothetical protein